MAALITGGSVQLLRPERRTPIFNPPGRVLHDPEFHTTPARWALSLTLEWEGDLPPEVAEFIRTHGGNVPHV